MYNKIKISQQNPFYFQHLRNKNGLNVQKCRAECTEQGEKPQKSALLSTDIEQKTSYVRPHDTLSLTRKVGGCSEIKEKRAFLCISFALHTFACAQGRRLLRNKRKASFPLSFIRIALPLAAKSFINKEQYESSKQCQQRRTTANRVVA